MYYTPSLKYSLLCLALMTTSFLDGAEQIESPKTVVNATKLVMDLQIPNNMVGLECLKESNDNAIRHYQEITFHDIVSLANQGGETCVMAPHRSLAKLLFMGIETVYIPVNFTPGYEFVKRVSIDPADSDTLSCTQIVSKLMSFCPDLIHKMYKLSI